MGFFSPVIRQHLAEVASLANGRLLDIGCGNKPYQDLFTKVTEYIGLDRPSSADLERPDPEGRRLHYDVEGPADELPFPAGRFETILCTQVIEHLPDPRKFFNEAARVAAPGAVLILSAPLVNPVHEAPYDFYRYTKFGLAELCRLSGWMVDSITPMGGSWLAIGYLFHQATEQRALSAAGGLRRRLRRMIGGIIYNFFSFLDRRDQQTGAPVGYLLVAHKPT